MLRPSPDLAPSHSPCGTLLNIDPFFSIRFLLSFCSFARYNSPLPDQHWSVGSVYLVIWPVNVARHFAQYASHIHVVICHLEDMMLSVHSFLASHGSVVLSFARFSIEERRPAYLYTAFRARNLRLSSRSYQFAPERNDVFPVCCALTDPISMSRFLAETAYYPVRYDVRITESLG